MFGNPLLNAIIVVFLCLLVPLVGCRIAAHLDKNGFGHNQELRPSAERFYTWFENWSIKHDEAILKRRTLGQWLDVIFGFTRRKNRLLKQSDKFLE